MSRSGLIESGLVHGGSVRVIMPESTHPGCWVKEQLWRREWTAVQLAQKTGLKLGWIRRLLRYETKVVDSAPMKKIHSVFVAEPAKFNPLRGVID